MPHPLRLKELSPAEVAEGLRQGRLALVDVREAHEHADERIEGALHVALSSLDPASLPLDPSRPVVFHCARGGRSATAVQRCLEAGVPVNAHLSGGITAWKSAGLATIRPERSGGGLLARLFGR